MATKKTYDAVIIGAGVIGSSISLHLSRLGYKVINIDSKPGAGHGTTSYSSGICRMFYSILDSVKFSWEGYHYWKDWENFIGVEDPRGFARLRECGGVIIRTKNSKPFLDKSVPCMLEAGVNCIEWDLSEAQEKLGKLGWDLSHTYNPTRIDNPLFGTPVEGVKVEGAVFCPETGYVSDPQLATMNLAFAAEQCGATFLYNTIVTEIKQQGGTVNSVSLSDGTRIFAPIVVNAAGPKSSLVNKLAFPGTSQSVPNDMKVTTRAMRQEVAYCEPPDGVDMDKYGMITTDLDIGAYWRPEVGNKILIGGTEPDCDPEEWVDGDIDLDMNLSLTENWENYVYRVALRIPNLPLPSGKKTQGIVSAYDVTPDWTPIYDKSSLGGYYLAIGTSGNQFKNAGVAGDLMATLIDSIENGLDHDNEPMQYELKRSNPGDYVNTKSFSRLRKINDTSGSVLG
jgi:sarcosine oxidase, subunit beta